jgi:hypothetical protein
MKCFGLAIALLAAASPLALGQHKGPAPAPKVLLSLPAGIPSETIQIRYFMTGPFGGYGMFINAAKGVSTYEIKAAVDGKPAAEVKVIAYIPGCEFETFDIQVDSPTVTESLLCWPIGTTLLHARISPFALIEEKKTKVDVEYVAFWASRFFGFMDGPGMTIHLGSVVPDANGEFEFEVPDFSTQDEGKDSGFEFLLRESKTGNLIALLEPLDEDGGSIWLPVRPSYPNTVRLKANDH